METLGAAFTLETDWIVATLGVALAAFSALAWFIKALIGQSEARIESSIRQVATQLTDLGDRVTRLEHQVDDTIIPKQERIARKLEADE